MSKYYDRPDISTTLSIHGIYRLSGEESNNVWTQTGTQLPYKNIKYIFKKQLMDSILISSKHLKHTNLVK